MIPPTPLVLLLPFGRSAGAPASPSALTSDVTGRLDIEKFQDQGLLSCVAVVELPVTAGQPPDVAVASPVLQAQVCCGRESVPWDGRYSQIWWWGCRSSLIDSCCGCIPGSASWESAVDGRVCVVSWCSQMWWFCGGAVGHGWADVAIAWAVPQAQVVRGWESVPCQDSVRCVHFMPFQPRQLPDMAVASPVLQVQVCCECAM